MGGKQKSIIGTCRPIRYFAFQRCLLKKDFWSTILILSIPGHICSSDYPSICKFVHPVLSSCPFICTFVCLFVQQTICPFIHSFVSPTNHPYNCFFVHPSINPTHYLLISLFIPLFVCPITLSIYLSVYLSNSFKFFRQLPNF